MSQYITIQNATILWTVTIYMCIAMCIYVIFWKN